MHSLSADNLPTSRSSGIELIHIDVDQSAKEEDTNILLENKIDEDILFRLKKRVENKRKSTFCTAFSIGLLILSIVLLLTPLTSKLLNDWKLYNYSISARCRIISSNTTNITNVGVCYYEHVYETIDGQPFTAKCGNKLHGVVPCDHVNDSDNNNNKCYVVDNDKCVGAMMNPLQLQRNKNVFVILLCIGSFFAVTTVLSSIYSIVLICSSGIYCSIMSVLKDDDKLMQKIRENRKKRKKKRRAKRNKYAKTKKRTRLKRIGDFDSILSSQFASSTLNSLHSGTNHEYTANSTVQHTITLSDEGDIYNFNL